MNPLTITADILPVMIGRLTPRQLEIIELLAQGHSNKDAASILGIRPITLQVHIGNACHRLELENRIQLIVLFVMWKSAGNLHTHTE